MTDRMSDDECQLLWSFDFRPGKTPPFKDCVKRLYRDHLRAREAEKRLKDELALTQEIGKGTKFHNAPKEGWTCYHCGINFKTPGAAGDHFGRRQGGKSKCQYHDMDVEKLQAENAELKARLKALEG